jgi:hypothetical protein
LDCVLNLKRLLPLVGTLLVALTLAGCNGEEAVATGAAAAPPAVAVVEPTFTPTAEPTVSRETAAAPGAGAAPAEPEVEPTIAAPEPATLAPLPAGLEDSGLLVDTAWLAANGNEVGVRVLDVRSTEEFDSGHIPGAVNVNWVLTLNDGAAPTVCGRSTRQSGSPPT